MQNLALGLVLGIAAIVVTILIFAAVDNQGSSCDSSSTVAVYNICKRLEICSDFKNDALQSDCRINTIADILGG